MKMLAYTRETKSSESNEDQSARISLFCFARGWEIVEEFQDVDPYTEGAEKVLSLMDSDKFDGIVFMSAETAPKLGTDEDGQEFTLADAVYRVPFLIRSGFAIVAVNGDIDTSTDDGIFAATLSHAVVTDIEDSGAEALLTVIMREWKIWQNIKGTDAVRRTLALNIADRMPAHARILRSMA